MPAGSRRRSRRVLFVITLAALTLVTLDASGVNAFEPVRSTASDIVSPLSGAVGWVTTPFRNMWNGITGYGDLEEENERLREELADYEGADITERNYAEQLERLTKQLDVSFAGDLPTQVARVASGPRNNFSDHRLEIDKVSDAGLEVGMPVVTTNGVVGRIERVATQRSVVQLATDPSFFMGVRVGDTQDIGIGHGSGPDGPMVVDRGIELVDEVEVGDVVVTSGLERAVMPPDLPVGFVAEVQPDEAASQLILRVDFAAEFSQLDVVQVLKWTPQA